jgi:hypothetical protein
MRVSMGASVLTLDDRGHERGVQRAQRNGRKSVATSSWNSGPLPPVKHRAYASIVPREVSSAQPLNEARGG